MLLSRQPLSRTEIYNSVETSVYSDGEHSKSLADEEGDYAKASELYSRSLETSDDDFVSSDVDLNGDFDRVSGNLKFDSDGVSRDFKLLLNQILCEFPPEHPLSNSRPLRDSLGHTPLQPNCFMKIRPGITYQNSILA